MKRWAVIVICGVGVAWWYPGLAAAAACGLVVGWLVLDQPVAAYETIQKIKTAVGG